MPLAGSLGVRKSNDAADNPKAAWHQWMIACAIPEEQDTVLPRRDNSSRRPERTGPQTLGLSYCRRLSIRNWQDGVEA